jgi:hypothetical protein
MPAICNIELNQFEPQGDEIKNMRSIQDEKLDSIDFFDNFNDNNYRISKLINRLNESYDVLILIPMIYSPYTLNRICSETKKKIIFLIWGSGDGYNIAKNFPIFEYDKKYSHVFYGFTNDKLYPQIYSKLHHKIITPLILNPQVDKYKDKWIADMDNNFHGIVVASRIYETSCSNRHIYDIADGLIKKHNITLHFYGKNDPKSAADFKYYHNFGCDIDTIYENMTKCNYFLYLFAMSNVIQYSALEAIFIGVPVFYLKSSFLSTLIGQETIFECNTFDDMGTKAKNLNKIDKSIIDANIKIQKNALHFFDNEKAKIRWTEALKCNFLQ